MGDLALPTHVYAAVTRTGYVWALGFAGRPASWHDVCRNVLLRARRRVFALPLLIASTCACGGGRQTERVAPSIDSPRYRRRRAGGSDRTIRIAGRVTGAAPGQRIVLYARSGHWWVQPLTVQPFTTVQPDGSWENTTHLGTEYAALLVDAAFRPPDTTESLPTAGGSVAAVATVKGTGHYSDAPKVLTFSGYEWQVRQIPSDRGGQNDYDPANAWTDAEGLLHLRLAKRDGHWTSAEVILTRSLGYGTYAFTVRDTSTLDPAAAFGMITWDEEALDQNHRELDIEISQWGDPSVPNAQYVAAAVLRAGERGAVLGAGRHAHARLPVGAGARLVPHDTRQERDGGRRRGAQGVHVGCPVARHRTGADEPLLFPVRAAPAAEGCRGRR